MIQAKHTKWAEVVFSSYINRLLKKNFHSFHLMGKIPQIDQNRPLILAPNHNSWWDGFFIYLLNEKLLYRKIYLMMLEEQLSKYPFFAKLGAYSIDPNSRNKIIESLRYTLSILENEQIPNHPSLICIFPQGELRPFHKRPLEFKGGIDWLVKKCGKEIQILLLAMRIEFLEEQFPQVFFQFDDVLKVDKESFKGTSWLVEREANLLIQLEQNIINKEPSFITWPGRESVHSRFDHFRQRLKLNRK
jgi:1-acyl-sn-glycerol-3-phosphate acyltransferase